MKLNYETCLVREKCVLVPYRPEHVPTYHEWMKDPDLLEATGSEPLSMEQEIAMQQSWRDDPHKCTFIVLARSLCEFAGAPTDDDSANVDADFVTQNLSAMVGDVNLFLSEEEEDDEHDAPPSDMKERDEKRVSMQAELDIMIADHNHRGQGLGREASCLMMMYGAKMLGIRRFYCKINEDNKASRGLFENLGFHECNYAECFRQVELELRRDSPEAMVDSVAKLLGRRDLQTITCPLKATDATK